MDKLIYTDQSTCAISSSSSRATAHCHWVVLSIHQALTAISRQFSGHWQVLLTTFTWHAPFARHASDKNHKLHQGRRCRCLAMLCSSIRDMIDQFVCFWLDCSGLALWRRNCILFSCHIESSPVCSMFAAWCTIPHTAAVHFTASLASCVSVAVVVLRRLACLLLAVLWSPVSFLLFVLSRWSVLCRSRYLSETVACKKRSLRLCTSLTLFGSGAAN